jgi:predicted transposase/invertase (TIGR01784 family)
MDQNLDILDHVQLPFLGLNQLGKNMLSKFLDPKNDFAFKKIFGTEKNKDILIHFLNDMLVFKEKAPIKDVIFLKTIQDPETAAKKTSIVDILCEDTEGNRYIVEMQVAKEKGFEKRAQYYAAKAYVSQMHVNGKYHDLKEVIFLAITNFTMFPQKQAFKSDHVIFDRDNQHHDLQDFSFTFIELEKFNKTIQELTDIVDKWTYFFKHADETSEEELAQLIGNDLIIEKAYNELNSLTWNDAERLTYEQNQKYEWDHQAQMEQKYDEGMEKGVEKGIEKGIEIGREEGMEKGVEKGIEIGMEKGVEKGIEMGAAQAKIAVAKEMILQGIDKKMIAQITGLPESHF